MVRKQPAQILIVDDEPGIIRPLQAALEAAGFKTAATTEGRRALEIVENETPDLMVLDIIMPEMDGFEVCRRIRQWSDMPIIMLSARQSEADKVECLNLGSDDYITKPFGTKELVARVHAVLRRSAGPDTVPPLRSFTCDNMTIDFRKRQVSVRGKVVRLTPIEYRLLQEMTLNAGEVLTFSYLLKNVWGPEYGQEKEYLRVYIGHLRSKLELDPSQPRHILTVPYVGYRFQQSPE